MTNVKIAGVPEHFNFPWHLAIDEQAFLDRGIHLEWTDVPEGTGRMCEMLRTNETDIAIILTEGIIKDIVAGNKSKIVQVYVKSPLVWGIHVAGNSVYSGIEDLNGKTAAISRFGSGSHLMSYVNAEQNHWDLDDLKFEVVNNLAGGIESLKKGQADYFMWEYFTTKPLVDDGTFKCIGTCPTPWPCFVIAVTDDFLINKRSLLKHILEVINVYTADFKNIPSIDRSLANSYNQKLEDISSWLQLTHWGSENINEEVLSQTQDYLHRIGLINEKVNFESIVAK